MATVKENDFLDNNDLDDPLADPANDASKLAAAKLHKLNKYKDDDVSTSLAEGTLALIGKAFAAYAMTKAVMDVFQYQRLNNIVLPGGNFGISRGQMPQISGDRLNEYFAFMAKNGVTFKHQQMKTADIRLTQNEYNKFKVLKLMDTYKKGKKVYPIIVSSDGFVLDGSHRFIAQHNLSKDAEIDVYKANVKIKELLDTSRKFAGAEYRNVSDATPSK